MRALVKSGNRQTALANKMVKGHCNVHFSILGYPVVKGYARSPNADEKS
jgi:hypothetical protein